MYILFIFIVWCLYAVLEGKREAEYFHYRLKAEDILVKEGRFTHGVWTLQRFLVLLLILIFQIKELNIIYFDFSLFDLICFILSLVLVFPFLHDGMYYTRRHKLNRLIYPKKWFDQSTTSTAFFTKLNTPIMRDVWFVLGVILLILSLSI